MIESEVGRERERMIERGRETERDKDAERETERERFRVWSLFQM